MTTELLALPASRTQIYTASAESGLPDDAARCYADALVGALSLDDLLSEDLTPEIESAIGAAQGACF